MLCEKNIGKYLKKNRFKIFAFQEFHYLCNPLKKGSSLSFKYTDKKDNVILFHSIKPE